MVDILSLLTNKWGWSHIRTCKDWNIPIDWDFIELCLSDNNAVQCGKCKRQSGYYNPEKSSTQCYVCEAIKFQYEEQSPNRNEWFKVRKLRRRNVEVSRYMEMKIRRKSVDKLLGYS